ncbi:MAG: acyl carrier protein [Geothrix sp.]|uniref:Acyl carrier protein n=1 Tax=Candidatus Geothrix odensensis TaxID=2954440 RepID=A0A936K777_9BACT|nr:acyl carrier protein [Holophagaceae bacterium]MBK8573861.1 acyl carrier protein [Candidatus Geothrix odensensis]MBP7618322.1 acyl carrier protein [Geothrix sp.]MCC6512721.1 acyl carrier protein [Geothrix sp.]
MTMTEQDIFLKLKEVLADSFRLDPEKITLDSHLFKDLDLDSIDAVELAIQLQDFTGRRVKAQEFKDVRTVGDVVTTIHRMLQS